MDAALLQSLLESGDSKMRSGDAKGAIAAYDEALGLESGNPAALESKATALVTSGDFEGALRCHDELVERGPHVASRYVARAQVLAHARKYTEALADLETALALNGPTASLLKEKGRCLRRLGRHSDAAEAYRAAIDLESKDPALWAALGDAYLEAGLVQEALEAFTTASHGEQSGFTDVDWTIRGDRSYAAGRYEVAITMYESALGVRPGVRAWYGLAKARHAVGQYEQAREAAARACELDPEDAEKWIVHGNVLYALDDLVGALHCFDSATRLNPNERLGWSNKAIVLSRMEREVDAVTAAERAVELSPQDPQLRLELGMYQYRLAQFEDAIKSFDRCLELDPRSMWAANNKSAALHQLGRLEESLEWCNRALEFDSSEAIPWNNKAEVLAELGREAQAFAVLEEALSKVEQPKEVLQKKSQILSDNYRRHSESLKVLEQARELDPEDNAIASDYAESLVKVGHYAQARAVARHVMARETIPSRLCAMRFIIFVSYALSSDVENHDDAFQSFVDYYINEFVLTNRPSINWSYEGLRAAIRSGSFSPDVRFLIETLMDVQEGRVRASDLSSFAIILERQASSLAQ